MGNVGFYMVERWVLIVGQREQHNTTHRHGGGGRRRRVKEEKVPGGNILLVHGVMKTALGAGSKRRCVYRCLDCRDGA